MPTCIKCQVLTVTSKRCPYCRVCYCSKACRSTDWSRHKSECTSGDGVSSRSTTSDMESSNTSFDIEEQLHCEGHPCSTCGKCRDWEFQGNQETWRWIQNYRNWNQDEKDYWTNNMPKFRKRDGATCFYQFSSPHYYHYINFHNWGQLGGPLSHIPGPFFDPSLGCLCDSNRKK